MPVALTKGLSLSVSYTHLQPRQEETQPEAVAAPAVTDAPPETVATSLLPDIEPEKPKAVSYTHLG